MIRESRKIWEPLMCESKIHSFYLIKDSPINVDLRINLESNHLKKDSNQLSLSGLSKKIATRFESQIIDSDLRQALDWPIGPISVHGPKSSERIWSDLQAALALQFRKDQPVEIL